MDRAGLSGVDASASAGGSTGGSVSAAGGARAPGSGGTLGGSGNSGSGGAASGGGSAAGGSGAGSGGSSAGSGGLASAVGSGGTLGLGGALGSGGAGSGTGGDQGLGGMAGSGGDDGSGGLDSGADGAMATGGVEGTGGAAGGGASGGSQGSGGMTGAGGSGGGHPPNCSSFPAGSTLTPPTDNLLHCYWAHVDLLDWDTAEATCVGEGGTLATILSSQENMAVFGIAMRQGLFTGMNVAWLGATDGKLIGDKSGPGKYAWVTGEDWGFINWHAGQPDGSCACQTPNECACDHWVAMSGDGTWYDRSDNTARSYVCEAVAR
ncbi:MAG TPA: C-type lectin domain-containing protein [Polyangia bacterium]